jgi:hypothetical protein
MCHAEFGKYIAESSLKITDIINTENVIKLFYEQILIFKGMK